MEARGALVANIDELQARVDGATQVLSSLQAQRRQAGDRFKEKLEVAAEKIRQDQMELERLRSSVAEYENQMRQLNEMLIALLDGIEAINVDSFLKTVDELNQSLSTLSSDVLTNEAVTESGSEPARDDDVAPEGSHGMATEADKWNERND